MKLKLCVVGFVLALTNVGAYSAEPLIPAASKGWKYQDRGMRTNVNWRIAAFDDSRWSNGPALLGYGDRDIRTQLSFGDNPRNKRRVAFFRRTFVAPRQFKRYFGEICCDDGAVVYVNGKEVQRFNMPAGPIRQNTLALSAVGSDSEVERKRHPFFIDPQLMQNGENVVAVSVHQANPTSSDLAFDLEFVGLESEEEIAQAQTEVDQHDRVNEAREANLGVSPVFHFKSEDPPKTQ